MKHTYSINPIDTYPKKEWEEQVTIHTNGVVIRRKNVRITIQEIEEGYVITTRTFSDKEIPEILGHPMMYIKRLRGNLYLTQRAVHKDSYECTTWGMNAYLEHMNDLLTRVWTHNGSKTE